MVCWAAVSPFSLLSGLCEPRQGPSMQGAFAGLQWGYASAGAGIVAEHCSVLGWFACLVLQGFVELPDSTMLGVLPEA